MAGANINDLYTYGNMKDRYSENTYVQQNVTYGLWNKIRDPQANEVNLDGQEFKIAVQFALNESYGSRNDGERLPDPLYPKGEWARYRAKLNYASMEMTTFAATRGHNGGRVGGKFVDSVVKGTMIPFYANLDADAYANGRGFRAKVETASGGASSFVVEFCTRLRPTMMLDWYDSTYTVKKGTIQISTRGIDMQARTVYIESGVFTGQVPSNAAAGDVLVTMDALKAGEPQDGRSIGGFGRITDASVALGGIAPNNAAWWLPTNINATGQNPNELILSQHIDAMNTIIGTFPEHLVINPAWRRAYFAGLLGQRMFTSNSFDTGASKVTFTQPTMGKDSSGKAPKKLDILEDKNADPTEYLLWADAAVCKAYEYSKNPHIADEDGTDFRYRHNFDSQHGFVRWWGNIIVNTRRGVGRGYGFVRPAGVI